MSENVENGGVSAEVAVRGSEAASSGDVMAKVRALSEGAPMIYSTVGGDDFESKKVTLNAVTNAEPVSEHLNKKIMLRDFVIQATTMIDDESGEERDILRTILIAADGKAYSAVSDGLFKSLQNYTALLGHPSVWPEGGVAVVVSEVKGRRGYRFMTIKLA